MIEREVLLRMSQCAFSRKFGCGEGLWSSFDFPKTINSRYVAQGPSKKGKYQDRYDDSLFLPHTFQHQLLVAVNDQELKKLQYLYIGFINEWLKLLPLFSEAGVARPRKVRGSLRGRSVKRLFLKIFQNSQENTCARVSFLVKLQT